MKSCRVCLEGKALSDFPRLARSADGYNSQCKDCKNLYDNSYYKSNPGRKEQITKNREENTLANKVWIKEYLDSHPCVDCGVDDFRVLQFDHRDRATKLKAISALYTYGPETLRTEVAKCDVRCANCHMLRTGEQFNWYAKW